MNKTMSRTKQMTYIAMMSALIAVCSQISVPFFSVPFTMQTFAVFVAAGLLGTINGSISVAIFILMGAVGLPVFAGFSGGIQALMGPTGGYIAGFYFSALVTGFIMDKWGKTPLKMIIAMFAGLAVCYALGTVWFTVVYSAAKGQVSLWTSLTWCVFPYIPFDAAKIVLAQLVCTALKGKI